MIRALLFVAAVALIVVGIATSPDVPATGPCGWDTGWDTSYQECTDRMHP